MERLIENALDWEHLPHLHGGSFRGIVVDHADAAGWQAQAELADGTPIRLELRLTETGWITRTFLKGALTSEIVSEAEATGADTCRVHVRFHVAQLPEERLPAAGAVYAELYGRLYDEDEAMMMARADALRRSGAERSKTRSVALADGRTIQVPLYCPHQGLPLTAEPDSAGIITCPWHGYRFNVHTGRALDGRACGWRVSGDDDAPPEA